MKKLIILLSLSLTVNFAFGQWSTNSTTYYNNPTSYNVGIGTAGGSNGVSEKLEVGGNIFINGENRGLIIDAWNGVAPVYKRVGFMKYAGHEGVISRSSNQDFGITRTSTSDVLTPGTLTYDFYIKGNGNVGIGNTDPISKLHITNPSSSAQWGIVVDQDHSYPALNINHNYSWSGGTASLIRVNHNDTKAFTILKQNSPFPLTYFTIYGDGRTVIGDHSVVSMPTGYKLYVQTGILTEKLKVSLTSGNWSDYVFEKDYKLKSLEEVSKYVKENKHLPGVPSAQELVDDGGFDVAKMDAKLLEKIEELTLYVIKLNEENKVLNERIQKLEQNK